MLCVAQQRACGLKWSGRASWKRKPCRRESRIGMCQSLEYKEAKTPREVSLPRSPRLLTDRPIWFGMTNFSGKGSQGLVARSGLSDAWTIPGPRSPRLTTDGDAALFPPHCGVCGVAPGPRGAAIWVAAEILLQFSPRMGGEVDAGIGNCSAGAVPAQCPHSLFSAPRGTGLPTTHSGLCG